METRFEIVDPERTVTRTAAVRRISALGNHWRAMVEAWQVPGGWRARLVFEPDGPASRLETRKCAPTFYGSTFTDVLQAAHDLSDDRLRELLHSFG